jgi:hypothetical protein
VSAASRLARADKQIVKPVPDTDIGLNSANVPGGISATPLDRPLHAGGLEWLPSHAEPWSCSIGYALAVELGSHPVSLVKAGA